MTTFGGKMRALMEERGVSLRQLAKVTHYDVGYLSKVANDLKRPSLPLAHQLEAALDAGGNLVNLVPARTGAQRRAPVASASIRDVGQTVTPRPLPAPVVDSFVDRRMQRLSVSHTEELLSHLREQWFMLVRTDNLLGPRHALGGVCAQLTILTALLRHVRPPLRDTALRLAARYAESAAWLYEDAGDLIASRRWTGHAMEYALEVGDRPMVAWTLFRRSQHAQFEGNGAQVVGLAEAACREQGNVAGPMLAAILQQHAHGLALSGVEVASHELLDRAQEYATTDDAGDARAGHGAFCTPAYLELQRGRVWLTLGRPGRAVDAFESAIRELSPTYQRDRGLAHAGLSIALTQERQPEAAASAAVQALTVAQDSGSSRIFSMLASVAPHLARHAHLNPVAEFLAGLAATPAV
ncbi:helix-turn-helix domain-containing protein [Nonomuraea ceibae]|uniref:helix-turn-helix domain-containing protein n=1 Tax=Nonomuraea ceibae TaxID=1935170 RepID=UPI001C5F6A10|nr:helix-turn-helix transcriptional regulator [Nonomuraea ceibae]